MQAELVRGEEGFVSSSVFSVLLGFPEAGGVGVLGWEAEPGYRVGRGAGHKERNF